MASPIKSYTPEEARVVRKAFVRLSWFLFVAMVFMQLDRTNVGFAGLTMQKALGLNAAMLGFSVTIFSIGYIVSEIPSNMLFAKYGAKIWLPRIMISWGLVSSLLMFSYDSNSLYALRFLLGMAEGGFIPGVLLYLSYWLPEYSRARAVSLFLLAQPASLIFGPLASGPLLDMDGTLGLEGWKWLFLIEGLPSVLLGIFAYFYLSNRPSEASWLSNQEKSTLQAVISREEKTKPETGRKAWRDLSSVTQLLVMLGYLGMPASLAAYTVWAPQIVRALVPQGSTFSYIGLISAIPAICSIIFLPIWSGHSDRTKERIWHILLPLLMGAAGWAMIALQSNPVIQMAGLSMAATGVYAAQGIYFTLATSMIPPAARPIGIALVSATGLIGASVSPWVTGLLKDMTGNFTLSLLFVSAALLFACLMTILLSWMRPDLTGTSAAKRA